MVILSHSVDETLALGQAIGAAAPRGTVIALDGPLGAGKTHLTRGIAIGARIADLTLVGSPTYVLLNIYPAAPADPAGKTVYHLDAYRTTGGEELEALGLEEWLAEPALIVIEWADRLGALLPQDHLRIRLEVLDESTRRLDLHAAGPQTARWLAAMGPKEAFFH